MFALLFLLAVGAQALPSAPLANRASCKCGIKRSSNRIVNGVNAGVNEFPWIAGMIQVFDGIETDSMCGGTLVADKWIVTAAHCLYKDNDFKTLLESTTGLIQVNPRFQPRNSLLKRSLFIPNGTPW